ncbi:MAG: NADH:flavin oxidoreductase [Hyphomonas sp. BRH_c22]|uniref:NADH:flavin oxidoreductase n=1 Tax=Hyphomonas sp. BRH_c22 TaxID=1629710 RepID=UPI0005F10AB3|nr:NADH:flavin oxidoreductase [Hyphomonas sp. BRH_c22]KJS38645.1 MAG: NADH:flavin oxidoreductase [Hyphomonas sp. BRH_c22]
MTFLHSPLTLRRGPALKNRFMLAPLTNLQSHPDGVLSDDEFRWLTLRAEGGFGLTMTCAAHVQAKGQGFPGQLGIFDDRHLPGLSRLAAALNAEGTHSVVQLHHAGMRSPRELIGEAPHCPSVNDEFSARALSLDEVKESRDAFIAAARRAEAAGFHGVELHGAHGYLICQFLSAEVNLRTDEYGGSFENRRRFLDEILDGVRAACGKDFSVGVRLSPERFGMDIGEILHLAGDLMQGGKLDYIDMSLWDVFKEPEDTAFKGKSLLQWFSALPRGTCRLGAAGKITTGAHSQRAMDEGLDFVVIGRAAIVHHDFPKKVEADPAFVPIALPVPEDHLKAEGLGTAFLTYMKSWKGFVAEPAQTT